MVLEPGPTQKHGMQLMQELRGRGANVRRIFMIGVFSFAFEGVCPVRVFAPVAHVDAGSAAQALGPAINAGKGFELFLNACLGRC